VSEFEIQTLSEKSIKEAYFSGVDIVYELLPGL